MLLTKRNITCFFLLLKLSITGAQNITGTWEGELSDDQFIQVNVIQVRDQLCGYTWDYIRKDPKSYCRVYFTGEYDKADKEWVFNGEFFIKKNGDHLLMHIRLTKAVVNGNIVLLGVATDVPETPNFFSFNSPDRDALLGRLDPFAQTTKNSTAFRDSVKLQKIADRPQMILPEMKDCYRQEQKLKDTISKQSRTLTKTRIIKPDQPVDSLVNIVVASPPPAIKKPDSVQLPEQMLKRKNTEEGYIEVNSKKITLNVYDNAIMDGDTVSIFYNGKLLLSHQRLSEKPIVVDIELDENSSRNEILLFAENLGSIPPNTALIVVTAGDKRYELFSKASLDENAVLVFMYKPK